jgi:class 3 adenylate cyclase
MSDVSWRASLSTGMTDESRLPGLARELEAVKRFPEGNPSPVFQVGRDWVLLYANPASAHLVAAFRLVIGDPLPAALAADLAQALEFVPPRAIELQAGEQTFSLLPVEAPELGVTNLYATDVTAARVLERFPMENPNPVLRMSSEGRLLFANAASAPIVAALHLEVGGLFPSEARAHLLRALAEPEPAPFEVTSDGRHYALHSRSVPELQTINIYGTDITALRAIDKFPDENPNPVLRVTHDGRLQYANPASDLLRHALGVGVGDALPTDFFRRIAEVIAGSSEDRLELEVDDRTFEVRAVSVYEFDFINLYGTDVTAARAIERANRENERLLLAILPPSIAERLRSGESTIADSFEEMTVLFADLVDFTGLSSRLSAAEVVRILNELFSAFDQLADRYGLEKIKTIGDAYMAVGGLAPHPEGRDPAVAVAEMALGIVSETGRLAASSGHDLSVRVGVHTGPSVAGVIGTRKFIYDVWGDAVNRASRMESYGVPGRVHVSEDTYRRLRGSFSFERRGAIEVKGLGRVTTYYLGDPRV